MKFFRKSLTSGTIEQLDTSGDFNRIRVINSGSSGAIEISTDSTAPFDKNIQIHAGKELDLPLIAGESLYAKGVTLLEVIFYKENAVKITI